jgi:hypothetical protein
MGMSEGIYKFCIIVTGKSGSGSLFLNGKYLFKED